MKVLFSYKHELFIHVNFISHTYNNYTVKLQNAGSESSEQGDVGVYIASLTHGTPAQQSGKIFIQDQILEVCAPHL